MQLFQNEFYNTKYEHIFPNNCFQRDKTSYNYADYYIVYSSLCNKNLLLYK